MRPRSAALFAPIVLCVPIALLTLGACASNEGRAGVAVSAQNDTRDEHIRFLVDEMRYMRGEELWARMQMLAEMGEEAGPHLRAAVRSEDALVRGSVAWILAAKGDRRNIPSLEGLLEDSVPRVRYEAAASLAKLGDPRSFPVLVDGLASDDVTVRYKTFQVLRSVTGREFGYRHDADPNERGPSVVRWREWLASVRASAL